jgi:ABC-type glycerol-3-phosphate transport system substrate-binding protein
MERAIVTSASRLLQVVAAFAALSLAAPVRAATDIAWWHAMSGELGRQLEKLASDFNASQPDYRVVPTYKGSYTETVTAAIFAFRSRSQPAIVQVNEVATATMTAAKGAIYPVFSLMRDMKEPFSLNDYLPAVSGYYTDAAGNLLSFPFNSSATQGSIRRRRRRPGRSLALLQNACAIAARCAASPPPGRPGSMSRIFQPSTICRWQRGRTALPRWMPS